MPDIMLDIISTKRTVPDRSIIEEMASRQQGRGRSQRDGLQRIPVSLRHTGSNAAVFGDHFSTE